MPVLKQEPEIFPDSIFELSEPWWVAHVRSRQEKSLARYLAEHQIAYYVPQYEKRVRRSNRNIVSYLPLFAGYVFFRGADAAAARALRSHLIVNLLSPFDQPEFHDELRQLYDLQRTSGRLIPHPHLHTGDSVVVTDGAFAGFQGVIVRERSLERLVVSISFIRQSVAVEVDRDAIRPHRHSETLRREARRSA